MAVIACDACGGKMNDGLAVCPHCGARRALTERPKLSNEEIRALIVTDPVARSAEPPRGMIQALVLPHPATSGAARIAEIALTVIGLPLVVSGAVVLSRKRRARLTSAAGGELAPALTMTVFGVVGLIGLPPLLVGASVAAVWLRALIRARVVARRVGDLHRVERAAGAPRPGLPTARALPAEPRAPAAAAPPVEPGAEPRTPAAPAPPVELGAEPRLLR
jgi:DNA-directed RNA polymerase subunit RPC12/RpoP